MATQVVMFSVLLFGMSGVVLDFGRVYSEHSRMQAFTDQAALAAASELNGRPDAILRAIDAVFTDAGEALVPKDGVFSNVDGRIGYNISHLYFVRSISDETGPQYALGDDLTSGNLLVMVTPDNLGAPHVKEGLSLTTAATQAKYVIAVGEERSVRNTLLRLINATSDAPVGERQRIRTISAAKHQRVSCGSFSNLVVCNPWENDPAQSFRSVMEDEESVGIHLKYTADGTLGLPNSLARRIDTQLTGVEGIWEICQGDPFDLPGYDPSMSAAEVAHARVVCMLAAAEQDEFCVPDEIPITPATADEVVTSLNVAFDMWDAPIAGVLDWDRDADGNHSQETDSDGNLVFNPGTAHPNRAQSSLFQPDLNIMKGRIWREDIAVVNESPTRPLSSRLNFPPIADVTEELDLVIHKCMRPDAAEFGTDCLTDSTGSDFSWISLPITRQQVSEYYITNFDHSYAYSTTGNLWAIAAAAPTNAELASVVSASEPELAEWHHAQSIIGIFPRGTSLALSGEDASLTMYLEPQIDGIPQEQWQPCIDDDTGAYADCDGDGLPYDPVTNTGDLEPAYSQYTYNIAGEFYDNQRRHIDVTVVNCGAVETDADGLTQAEVVGFAELYLLTPPKADCGDGSEDCPNPDLASSDIYVEFVGTPSLEEDHYAVLVR